jgi:hypothetical protein
MGDGVVEGLRIGLGLVVVGDSGVRCMVKVAGVRWMMGVIGDLGMGSIVERLPGFVRHRVLLCSLCLT